MPTFLVDFAERAAQNILNMGGPERSAAPSSLLGSARRPGGLQHPGRLRLQANPASRTGISASQLTDTHLNAPLAHRPRPRRRPFSSHRAPWVSPAGAQRPGQRSPAAADLSFPATRCPPCAGAFLTAGLHRPIIRVHDGRPSMTGRLWRRGGPRPRRTHLRHNARCRCGWRWPDRADVQPPPAAASPGSAVLPEMVRPPPGAWVISTRRGWVLGETGMVTCKTPSA